MLEAMHVLRGCLYVKAGAQARLLQVLVRSPMVEGGTKRRLTHWTLLAIALM